MFNAGSVFYSAFDAAANASFPLDSKFTSLSALFTPIDNGISSHREFSGAITTFSPAIAMNSSNEMFFCDHNSVF